LERFLCSLGDHLQDLSPTTRLFKRHQRIHVIQDEIAAISSLPCFPLLKFSCSYRYSISLSCLNAPQMARKHGVALEAIEAVAASAPLRAEYSHLPCVPQAKRFINAPSRHGKMRKCEGTSKVAMKAKRAHAEIYMQYEHPDAHVHIYITNAPN
jgi:hypothetical protein